MTLPPLPPLREVIARHGLSAARSLGSPFGPSTGRQVIAMEAEELPHGHVDVAAGRRDPPPSRHEVHDVGLGDVDGVGKLAGGPLQLPEAALDEPSHRNGLLEP